MSFGISSTVAQHGQSALLESPLVSSYTPCRATKGARNLFLLGPSLIDETDHRIRLGHLIAQCVLRDDNARHDHHPMPVLRSYQAMCIDPCRAIRRVYFRK
jgi:hypothetical protein